jgi:hypothetical protein
MPTQILASSKLLRFWALVLLVIALPYALAAQEGVLVGDTSFGNGALVWKVPGKHEVHIDSPELTIDGVPGASFALEKQTLGRNLASLDYAVSVDAPGGRVNGDYRVDIVLHTTDGDECLRHSTELNFSEPIRHDVRITQGFRIPSAARAMITEKTRVTDDRTQIYSEPRLMARELSVVDPLGAYYDLGLKSTDLKHVYLSMPVVGVAFKESVGHFSAADKPLFLAIASDPYAGSQFYGLALKGKDAGVKVTLSCTYAGSIVPVLHEHRTLALDFHHKWADGIIRTFYETIPEIEPAPPWTHAIAANYYDYHSQEGEGWFRNIQKLAEVFPLREQRAKIVFCLHGWYDYDGMYTFDYATNSLAASWMVFKKYPMTKQEVHRRIKFATDLGFRVVLYFADGMNSSGVPNDIRRGHAYVYANGKTRVGWAGPTGGGGPALDPSSPVVQQWFRAYLRALLKEYATEISGLVFDETNYFVSDDVSYRDREHPAYADRAMMALVRDLSLEVQEWRKINPDLVFLEGSHYLYGLVAHGSYTDMSGFPLIIDYRNSSWQTAWSKPGIRNLNMHYRCDTNIDYPYGLDLSLSDGYADTDFPQTGPARMSDDAWSEVTERFQRRIQQGPRLPKVSEIEGIDSCGLNEP